MYDLKGIFEHVIEQALVFLPKLLIAVLILILGWITINIFAKLLGRKMRKYKVELSLIDFIIGLFKILTRTLLLLTVVSMVGIKVTSFITMLGAASLGLGLALQGSLSNFAGGALILLFKPFKVGDYITAQGQSGTVKSIQIFYTVLKTVDNVTVIIPNGQLSNSSVVNYSMESKRRIDLEFGIGYGNSVVKAKKILLDLIKKDNRILEEPKPFVAVKELKDSSVNLLFRVWTHNDVFWNTKYDIIEKVKLEFDKKKINIPYPQMDIHMKKK